MKKGWIVIIVVLLILTVIGLIWYRNRKLLNKASTDIISATPAVPPATGVGISSSSVDAGVGKDLNSGRG